MHEANKYAKYSSAGHGYEITWKHEPCGDGADVEDIISVVIGRLEQHQKDLPCNENAMALANLNNALDILNSRTSRRKADGTEGTRVENQCSEAKQPAESRVLTYQMIVDRIRDLEKIKSQCDEQVSWLGKMLDFMNSDERICF